MKKRLINIFIGCIFSCSGFAQVKEYKFYAALDTVKTSGFYNIIFTSEMNAHLKTDYSDVRVVDEAGKWVPHILHSPTNETIALGEKRKLPFSITENNKSNTIILISENKLTLNNISLVLKNTEAERYCKISGSDDSKKWFVINDSILINPTEDNSTTETDFRIVFPKSNYNFYKLEIINNNKDPFSIKNILTNSFPSDVSNIKLNKIQNPTTTLQQKDTAKFSYIKVTQQQPFHFDMLNLKISGTKFYSRKIELYVPNNELNSFSNMGSLIESFDISNKTNLQFNFPKQASTSFYILIYNEDNLPLKITEVITSVNECILTTYLEKGQPYKLLLDNEAAKEPIYDLENTPPSAKDIISTLGVRQILSTNENKIVIPKAANNNKWIIWIALAVGLFVLLFLTRKMIKEVDKKTGNAE
jgi:hypothetical protein